MKHIYLRVKPPRQRSTSLEKPAKDRNRLLVAGTFSVNSTEYGVSSVVELRDKILNAGWIYFILRPVIEQKSLDRLEEVVVVDGGLDIVVGGEV